MITGRRSWGPADFHLGQQLYRQRTITPSIRIAVSYVGQTNVEVIAPLDDAESPWGDGLQGPSSVPIGGAVHHLGIFTKVFEESRGRILTGGIEPGFALVAGGRRVEYFDARESVGSFLELIEWAPWADLFHGRLQESCATWDGHQPRRSYADAVRDAQQEWAAIEARRAKAGKDL